MTKKNNQDTTLTSVASLASKVAEKKEQIASAKKETNLISLTPEDLNYLKILNMKTSEIKGMIGDLEITKARLLGDYNTAINTEKDFVNQLYSKYDIQEDKDFSINRETGEITYVTAEEK